MGHGDDLRWGALALAPVQPGQGAWALCTCSWHLGVDSPGPLQVAHLQCGNIVLGKTPATAQFGFEPEPPGDKPTFVIVPFGGERWGALRVGGGGFCPWPSTALASCPEDGFSASTVCSTCVSGPEIQTRLEKAHLRYPVFLSRGPAVGVRSRRAQGPTHPAFLTTPGRR